MKTTMDKKHMSIITNDQYASELNTLFYADSNEKIILTQKIKEILEGNHYKSAIDIGCGPGLVAKTLNKYVDQLTLLDVTPDYFEQLKLDFPNAKIFIGSILDFQFPDTYDLILLSHVLYYISVNEWENLLKKLYSKLNPNGKLIIVHAPFSAMHEIFSVDFLKKINIAYMNKADFDQVLSSFKHCRKDFYHSTSYYHASANIYAFAKHFIKLFFGVDDEALALVSESEIQKVLKLFSKKDGKLALGFHNDMYIITKP